MKLNEERRKFVSAEEELTTLRNISDKKKSELLSQLTEKDQVIAELRKEVSNKATNFNNYMMQQSPIL